MAGMRTTGSLGVVDGRSWATASEADARKRETTTGVIGRTDPPDITVA